MKVCYSQQIQPPELVGYNKYHVFWKRLFVLEGSFGLESSLTKGTAEALIQHNMYHKLESKLTGDHLAGWNVWDPV